MKNRLVETINKVGRKIVLPLVALSIAAAPLYAQSNDQKRFYELNLNDEKLNGSHNFKDTERILFSGHDSNWKAGDIVKWELYGPRGGLVDTFKYTISHDKENRILIYSNSPSGTNEMSTMMNNPNGGDGNYKSVWYIEPFGSNGWQIDGQDDLTVSH